MYFKPDLLDWTKEKTEFLQWLSPKSIYELTPLHPEYKSWKELNS